MHLKLTQEIEQKLVADLESGAYTVGQAAERAGVRVATVRAWLARGARAQSEIPVLLAMAAISRAAAVGRERAARGAVGQRLAELVRGGASLRAAAAGVGVPYEAARLLVRDAPSDSPLAVVRGRCA